MFVLIVVQAVVTLPLKVLLMVDPLDVQIHACMIVEDLPARASVLLVVWEVAISLVEEAVVVLAKAPVCILVAMAVLDAMGIVQVHAGLVVTHIVLDLVTNFYA